MVLKKVYSVKRIMVLLIGILFFGFGIALLRISCFGVDPYSCFVLSISNLTGVSFGTLILAINIILLAVMIIFGRRYVGIGSIINMIFVGYISDFFVFVFYDLLKLPEELNILFRILFLVAALVIFWLGVAMYLAADLGSSPYDGLAYAMESKLPLSFRINRIITDAVCLISGGTILYIVGGFSLLLDCINIGTLILAFCTGPIVALLRSNIEKYI